MTITNDRAERIRGAIGDFMAKAKADPDKYQIRSKRKSGKNAHTVLVNAIVADLQKREHCFAWSNQTGAAKRDGRWVRYGYPGSADVLACYRGRMLALEAKTGTGVQSDKQKTFEGRIWGAGGIYKVIRDIAEVQSLIMDIDGGPQ